MEEYIQLPPLPADTPWDVLNVTWEFAKLNEEERIDALKYLEALEDFTIGLWNKSNAGNCHKV